MKSEKTAQAKGKRTAEEWVAVAREFGEKCQVIQKDAKLNEDQKLDKQKHLAEQLAKEIKEDTHLNKEDREKMLNSIKNYMTDWEKIYGVIKNMTQGKK